MLAEHLQGALNSRSLIEQAKGVIAERTGFRVDQACTVMRGHARRHGLPLESVAADVVAGRIRLQPPRGAPEGMTGEPVDR